MLDAEGGNEMGFRFRKSIRLGKYARINLGKKSMGLSVGVRGARMSFNTKGRQTTSVGIPGSGLYYTSTSSLKKGRRRAGQDVQTATPPAKFYRYFVHPETSEFIKQRNGLSFVGLFFGPLYLFYKRYWVQAIVWTLISLLDFIIPIMALFIGLFIACYINAVTIHKLKKRGFVEFESGPL
jgi:hypothetical protein